MRGDDFVAYWERPHGEQCRLSFDEDGNPVAEALVDREGGAVWVETAADDRELVSVMSATLCRLQSTEPGDLITTLQRDVALLGYDLGVLP